MKNKAFTLAEVLITLGIIGVVAAITIPTLVQKYKEKAWNTSATVFERKIAEATRVMNSQMTLIGYSTTSGFVQELSKHMKIIKTCDSAHLIDCFSDKFYWGSENVEINTNELTTSDNLEKFDYETELVGVQFANGVSAIMTYDKNCRTQDPYSNQINTTGCLGMIYDTDGFKKPNTMGKDLRGFNGVSIKSYAGCEYAAGGLCMSAAFSVDPISTFKNKATYDSLKGVAYKVPCRDYYDANNPSYLAWQSDVFAAANYECIKKGMRLPTEDEMYDLAKYLYSGSNCGLSSSTGCALYEDRLAKTPMVLQVGNVVGGQYVAGPEKDDISMHLNSYTTYSPFFSYGNRTANGWTEKAFCVK